MANANSMGELVQMRDAIREFAAERDWDQFHTPRNLATALIVEAGELLEPFQWLQSGECTELSAQKQEQIRHEIADVLIYLIRLADKLDVNLYDAVSEKIEINRARYPERKVRGDPRKYNEY